MASLVLPMRNSRNFCSTRGTNVVSMEEYDFVESLRPKTDENLRKERNSAARSSRIPFEVDESFVESFKRELILMRMKYPFLTDSQVQGRTLDKFCIPNLMGKPYKKNKYGNITMCSVQSAVLSAKKSFSERKFSSSRKHIETKRRHTIGGSYFPIDITFNKMNGRRSSKACRKLFKTYTLYSDEMDTDDYSIQDSSNDDSGLEDFSPDEHSQSLEHQFRKKPPTGMKNIKTYLKLKHPTPSRHGTPRKANNCKNMKNASNKVQPISDKIIAGIEGNYISDRSERSEKEINKSTEPPMSIMTSDYDGDTIGSSVDIIEETPTDERQIMKHECSQQNLKKISSTVMPMNKKSLEIHKGKTCDIFETNEINKITKPSKSAVTLDSGKGSLRSPIGIIDETQSTDEMHAFHHESSEQSSSFTYISETIGMRRKSPCSTSSDIKFVQRRKKASISYSELRTNSHSCDGRIKQSISHVSEEYMETFSEHNSGSITNSMEFNSGFLCGVKCMKTSKVNVPQLKLNLSVCSEDSGPGSANHEKQLRAISSAVAKGKYKKCSESMPYVDEALQNALSENNLESDESPMSEMEEEEDDRKSSQSSYSNRKTSCSSMDSYPMQHNGRFSPYIFQLHSSPGSASVSSDGEYNIGTPNLQGHAINEEFGNLRENSSPLQAGIRHTPRYGSYQSPPSWSTQESTQLSQSMAQLTTQAEMRTGGSGEINDGYFLANLFDDYTSQSVRRTLRSSFGPQTSSQEDDGVLDVE
ncbi:uncharacterized protein LOC124162873 [Ischnura elegans]|uniref:uncharacterized protein LOC124162873 n=1 Tax=Ischnura elegans TaxID=197161 RepID=UPI001ED8A017|nr:uncharacterized protein LOC124162873 [Ischnura elegans]